MRSAVDNPMRGFPQTELVDDLIRKHEHNNKNNLQVCNTGNIDQKISLGVKIQVFIFLTLTFDYVNQSNNKI